MKNSKKGLSLFAAAAFVVLSLIPAASLASTTPPVLPVLTTSAAVSVTAGSAAAGEDASTATQYAALPTASPALIMPGQELQLQVAGALPSPGPANPATRIGWYYGASVQDAAASQSAVPNTPTLPEPGSPVPTITVKGAAAASAAPAGGENAESTAEPSPVPATDVQSGTTRAYAYVAGPYAPQTEGGQSTWWGGGFNVQCVTPALNWAGLYTSTAQGAGETASSSITAGTTRYATVTWSGALPPAAAAGSVGDPGITVSVKNADGQAARGLTCDLPNTTTPSTLTQLQLHADYTVVGGAYTVSIAPRATTPSAIASIARNETVNVLGYQLETAPGGTTGAVGQRATSVVQWSAANQENCAGVPTDASRLIYRWTAHQTPAPQFADGVYDAATNTITAQTTAPLTDMAGPYQYTVQAYYPAGVGIPETAVGQPVVVTLGNISNYSLLPVESEKTGVVAAVGSRAASSVAWATGGTAQTPKNPSTLTYVWTATGTNAASAPALTAAAIPATGAIATAQTETALTMQQVGTYTYTVQAYDATSGTRVPIGNPASITLNVVVPELEGDPAVLRATSQTAPDLLLKVRWDPAAAPTDPAWLANVEYRWTPQTENDSTWPVIDVTTKQPSNALRSNFEGGSPNIYTWRVQAIYTDPDTGRATNVGNPVDIQLDLYAENTLVAAYETGSAFTTKVGESASMSVVWANGFTKTGETYTWTAPEGAPAIDPPSTSTSVTTAVTSADQGGKTLTYSVQPYTPSGMPDGDPAQVQLYVQPYLLKPANATPSVDVGESLQLEAAWSAEGGAAVPAEDAQLTYTWSGPEPEDVPAVTGDGLKAAVAAPEEEGEWTYTLSAQMGAAPNAVTIATAQFVVTAIDDTPEETPALDPLPDSDVTISTADDVKYIVGEGLTVTASGHTVDDVISMMHTPPEGCEIQITTDDGGEVKGDDEIVGTGNLMQLIRAEGSEQIEQAVIVVRGDVMGNGRMSLTQLVQLAAALTGTNTLEGANLMAGDLDGTGKINLTDLVREAALYKNEMMNPSPAPEPSATPAPTPTSTPEISAQPSASPEGSADASSTPDTSASAAPSQDAEASATPAASSSPSADSSAGGN